MSSVASLHLVSVEDLPAIAAAGTAGLLNALRATGQEADDEYFWPGEHLLFVVEQLWHGDRISFFSASFPSEERLLNDEASVTFIIGPEHKALLPMLRPSIADASPIVMGLVAKGVRPAEAGLSARDALTLLYEQIEALPGGQVLIINVS